MRIFAIVLAILVPIALFSQQPAGCDFTLSAPLVKQAVITGADGIKAPLYVMNQPDSPVEILSVDLTGSTFDVQQSADGFYRYSSTTHCKVKVRNRGNLPIRLFEVSVGSNGSVWSQKNEPFGPGQEMELTRCGGGGSGHGKESPSVVISVHRVEFDGCTYQPSMRFPRKSV